jgi:hypothetical protein
MIPAAQGCFKSTIFNNSEFKKFFLFQVLIQGNHIPKPEKEP